MIRFGVIGLGKIAHTFLKCCNYLNVPIEGVASRSLENAKKYQEEYHAKHAYGSYKELLENPDVDAIYLATPHGLHYEQIKMILEYNKPILVEKAFCMNTKEAEEVLKLAEEKKVLVMEAMWTRFLPAIKKLEEIVNSNKYGKVKFIQATFNFEGDLSKSNRLMNKELGGGAIYDIGIYPLTLCNLLLGKPTELEAEGELDNEGVDVSSSYVYSVDGVLGMCNCSFNRPLERTAKLILEKAYIYMPSFWASEGFEIRDLNNELLEKIELPFECNGFEYQIRSFIKTLEEGKIENSTMPHSKTIEMLKIIDEVNRLMHE